MPNLANVPVRERSIPRSRRNYQALVRNMDLEQVQYLAAHCATVAAHSQLGPQLGTHYCHSVALSEARTSLQYLAFAAYWRSIADHILLPVPS